MSTSSELSEFFDLFNFTSTESSAELSSSNSSSSTSYPSISTGSTLFDDYCRQPDIVLNGAAAIKSINKLSNFIIRLCCKPPEQEQLKQSLTFALSYCRQQMVNDALPPDVRILYYNIVFRLFHDTEKNSICCLCDQKQHVLQRSHVIPNAQLKIEGNCHYFPLIDMIIQSDKITYFMLCGECENRVNHGAPALMSSTDSSIFGESYFYKTINNNTINWKLSDPLADAKFNSRRGLYHFAASLMYRGLITNVDLSISSLTEAELKTANIVKERWELTNIIMTKLNKWKKFLLQPDSDVSRWTSLPIIYMFVAPSSQISESSCERIHSNLLSSNQTSLMLGDLPSSSLLHTNIHYFHFVAPLGDNLNLIDNKPLGALATSVEECVKSSLLPPNGNDSHYTVPINNFRMCIFPLTLIRLAEVQSVTISEERRKQLNTANNTPSELTTRLHQQDEKLKIQPETTERFLYSIDFYQIGVKVLLPVTSGFQGVHATIQTHKNGSKI